MIWKVEMMSLVIVINYRCFMCVLIFPLSFDLQHWFLLFPVESIGIID